MYIKRKLENTILRYLEAREILAVIGPRQSGKTTLLQRIQSGLPDALFLSLEDVETLELFDQDIKSFAKRYLNSRYLFIDEFQYSKKGGKQLKYLYDAYPLNKIIISGSSALDLTVRAIKFLTGRIFVFHLYPLDFEEFIACRDETLLPLYRECRAHVRLTEGAVFMAAVSAPVSRSLSALLDEFIVWGGYPRVALARDDEERRVVLKNIYNTYFLRDIKDTLGLVDDFKLAKLIKAVAIQTGQLVAYQSLAQIAGYDFAALKRYLSILEKTFICFPVSPFFRNKQKEIVKNPKFYFFDTGFRNHVLGDFKRPNERADQGSAYENFVISQLVKAELPARFWRTKAGAEVDFVAETERGLLPIEVKSDPGKQRVPRSLNAFIDQYRPAQAVVLRRESGEHERIGETEVHFLPHWML